MDDNSAKEWLNGNELSYQIWTKKYRRNNETFEQWLDRVSNGNEKVKELIKSKRFIFGGRTLANRGIENSGSYSNCYSIGYVEDNLNEILQTNTDIAKTFCAQGGQGLSLSKIRPEGTLIKGNFTTDGIVPFMKMFNTTTETISQGGSRKGALMMSLDVWHPEIEKFISIKSDANAINKANLSVEIDDEFIMCVKQGVTEVKRTFKYDGGEYEYKVNPVAIFEKICENALKHAEPGVLFTNRLRNYNFMEFVDGYEIETTNPCVTGDTLILTKNGYEKIENLVNTDVVIWNGYQWSLVTPQVTGNNQDVYKVSFSDGTSVNCTKYHKWLMNDNNRKETQDLKNGDKLIKCFYPIIESQNPSINDKNLMYTYGFFSGDGSYTSNGSPVLYLYGEKQNLLPFFVNGVVRIDKTTQERVVLTIQENKNTFDKEFVPDVNYSINDRLNWLSGLIDADGSLNSSDGGITITSINNYFLNKVKCLLNTLGCNATLNIMKDCCSKMMPNHKGGVSEYNCKTCYRLTINASNVYKLMNLGLKTNRVILCANPNRDASRFIQVVDIEYVGKVDTVYCLNEPYNHTFIANGVITGNCGEQPLPKHGACNLCSINLSEYVVNPFTKDAYVDVELLQNDIKVIVEVMDDVLEENIERHALPEQREMARKYRNIGIGIMGVADMFVKMGLTYGSEESVSLIRKVMQLILHYSLSWSVIFGEKKGSFPCYDKNVWESNIFTHLMNKDKDSIEYFKSTNALRNATLLSVAPTGSIGTMFDVSTGIEPFFRLEYVRTTKSLNGKDEDYKCEIKSLKEYHEITGNDDIPEYFITSDKIDWKNRINIQSAIQEFCDTGISSTINLPKNTTLQDIKDLYLYAYDKGLKGVTVYVDGSREGILTEKGNQKSTCERQLNNSVKRPKSLESTFYPIKVKGEYFGVIVGYLEDEPYELFAIRLEKNIPQHEGKTIKFGKNHYGFESDLLKINNILETELSDEEKSTCLYVSMLLRHDVGIKHIVKTTKKTSDSIASFSSAICRVLSKYVEKENTGEKCPNCGGELVMEGGCIHCSSCEYSKCGD